MKANATLSCIGLIAMFIVSVVGGGIVGGWVLSILWGWFIVPTFHAPTLSVPVAIGISIVAAMLTHQKATSDDNSDKGWSEIVGKLLAITLFAPLLTLFIGWIVYQFV